MTSNVQRQRYVRVASHAVHEQLRTGAVKLPEALEHLRKIHADAGWPFDEAAQRQRLDEILRANQ